MNKARVQGIYFIQHNNQKNPNFWDSLHTWNNISGRFLGSTMMVHLQLLLYPYLPWSNRVEGSKEEDDFSFPGLASGRSENRFGNLEN